MQSENPELRIASAGPKPLDGPTPGEGARPEEKGSSTFSRVIETLLRGTYLFLGLVAIFALSYLTGHRMLEGTLGGNDTPWALSLVMWFDRWFPDLPIWYPLQGAGTPLTVAYPLGTHILVVLLHRISGLTEVQAFRLVGFLSVPITASGIYLLVWAKLRNQTMALLAGLFYLMSAAAWSWLNYIGIFAQAVSLMYFAPAFLVFDLYIRQEYRDPGNSPRFRDRLVLPIAAILYGLMFLSHMATALSFSMAVLLYALLVPWTESRNLKGRQGMRVSVTRTLKAIIAGLALVAFWLVPFIRVQGQTNREGLSEFAAHQIPYTDLGALLGLSEPPTNFGIWSVQFAIGVAALAFVGIIMAVRREKTVAAWGIVAISMAIFTAMPGLLPGVVALFDRLWAYSHIRAISATMILLPAIAGYGAGALAGALVQLPGALAGFIAGVELGSLAEMHPIRLTKQFLVIVLSFGIAVAAVLLLRLSPHQCQGSPSTGPPNGEAFWPFCFSSEGIQILREPQFVVSDEGPDYHKDAILSFIPELGLDAATRMDVSAFLGTLTQSLSLYSDVSIIGIYNYQSSMIHAMWGFLQGVFYSNEYGTPHEMGQLARWFGIQYVALNRDFDPIEKYDYAGWPVVFPTQGAGTGGIEIRQVPEAPELASLLHTPVILVIGGYENGSYDQIFRVFLAGATSFDDGLLVEGTHSIDDYTISELRNFDAVILHGYGYRNKKRAWDLLNDYVKDGGSLYVDTGWQFETPDWEMPEAPDVLPVYSLTWANFGIAEDYVIEDRSMGVEVNAGEFAPLDWKGQAWSVSTPSNGLRGWAHTVLSVDGSPLIAGGDYGKGRVIWSGMNFIAHTYANDSAAERGLLRGIVEWLLPAPSKSEHSSPAVQRDHPDHIRFTLEEPIGEGVSLLWREAYSPDWHASVEINGRIVEIPIYRAGSGMMLLMLPTINATGTVVQLDYSLGWYGWAGIGISVVMVAGLTLGITKPGLANSVLARVRRTNKTARPKGHVEWLPDLDGDQHIAQGAPANLSEASKGLEPRPSEAGSGAVGPWGAARGIAEEEDLEKLWAKFVETDDNQSSQSEDAEQMIDWWRRTRSNP